MGKAGKDFYETFDSGDGPTVPDGCEDDFANRDSAGGLKTDNAIDDMPQSNPEMPSKKR